MFVAQVIIKRFFVFAALVFASQLFASSLQHIVVFGDSLSDNGNFYENEHHQPPPSPDEGRFSDGPVWVEYLSNLYFPSSPSTHLLDYAFGGAEVSSIINSKQPLASLAGQINAYLSAHGNEDQQDNLFIVWIGSNNYLGAPPDESHHLVAEINDIIVDHLQLLASKGAKKIMVVNLPDLSKAPFAKELDRVHCDETDAPDCASKALNYFSKTHNAHLAKRVETLKEQFTDVNWVYYDIAQLFNDVIDNPARFHLRYVDKSCLQPQKYLANLIQINETPLSYETNCDDYLFFDMLHPTTYAHKVIAEQVYEFLKGSGVELY